jgi:rod shape-determining protein MreC
MAPPANRRSGYSRRAHNNIFFAYVAAGIGLVVGGGLLIGSLGGAERLGGLRGLAQDVTQPAAQIAAQGRAGAGGLFANLAAYATWGPENARLKQEVVLGRVKAVEAAALTQENQRLKALLKLADDTPKPIAYGWLVASSSGSTRRFATISVGASSGVIPGMPVRAPEGLIGRVLDVGHHSARILMITDSESVVPVRRASDGIPAFATGKGDGTLQLRLLTLGINPLKVGDAFVTSGSGGLYWPGTPIAVVASLTRDGAIARVLGDPAASEMVAVQPAWAPTQDPTLPPLADPAAAKAKAKAAEKKAE